MKWELRKGDWVLQAGIGEKKNIEDYQDLARTYFDKADCDGAIETLQKLLRLNPANTGAKIDLGGAQ